MVASLSHGSWTVLVAIVSYAYVVHVNVNVNVHAFVFPWSCSVLPRNRALWAGSSEWGAEARHELVTDCLVSRMGAVLRKNETTSWWPGAGTEFGASHDDDVESIDERTPPSPFLDLCSTREGEQRLETLAQLAAWDVVVSNANDDDDDDVNVNVNDGMRRQFENDAVTVLRSLLILGMQFGVKGPPDVQTQRVSHLKPSSPPFLPNSERAVAHKLKWERDVGLGTRLLTLLKWKRTAQGAFNLLVQLGVWTLHENIHLLRSGRPLRFTAREEAAAQRALSVVSEEDTEEIPIRKDLRSHVVYTIDDVDTTEVDDGLSVERLSPNEGGEGENENDTAKQQQQQQQQQEKLRYWIHIADVDRWAPVGSELRQSASSRTSSVYLPTGTWPMFPSSVVSRMSLQPQGAEGTGTTALSLGVCLHDDGSLDPSSIVVTPSLVNIHYQLSYDEANDMLEEGVAYDQEWPLGALYVAAQRRRQHRIRQNAVEAMVPRPIPKGSVSVDEQGDITVTVRTTHNAGRNASSLSTEESFGDDNSLHNLNNDDDVVSPSQLLVTELMILAGEAMGIWASAQTPKLLLPYRSQRPPDFDTREHEAAHYQRLLLHSNDGNNNNSDDDDDDDNDIPVDDTARAYRAAWYVRRFMEPAQVISSTTKKGQEHAGMGLDAYVQWTSPIRRYSDLRVHSAVKAHLRRQQLHSSASNHNNNDNDNEPTTVPDDAARGMFRVCNLIQNQSRTYWMHEYLRRKHASASDETYRAIVLGCVDVPRNRYVVYLYDLGLETYYTSQVGGGGGGGGSSSRKSLLQPGQPLWLRVSSVDPRQVRLTLALASPPQSQTPTSTSTLTSTQTTHTKGITGAAAA